MVHKQPFLAYAYGIETLVRHPIEGLFEPLSVAQAVSLLGTDRLISQIDVGTDGNPVRTLYRPVGSDTLEVRERLQQPLIIWGNEPPVRWKVTRYVYLGKDYEGGLNVRVEEGTIN